jgi:hypothetical protein
VQLQPRASADQFADAFFHPFAAGGSPYASQMPMWPSTLAATKLACFGRHAIDRTTAFRPGVTATGRQAIEWMG